MEDTLYEEDVLAVNSDNSSVGLNLRPTNNITNPNLIPGKITIEGGLNNGLLEVIARNFSPLFRKYSFRNFLGDVLTHNTFFINNQYSEENELNLNGGVFSEPSSPFSEWGIYIDVEDMSDKKLEYFYLHEFAHLVHFVFSEKGKDPFKSYDMISKEVVAISAERLIHDAEFSKEPYKTAHEIVLGLEKDDYYSSLEFYQQFKFLLEFPNHEDLLEYLHK